MNTSNKKSWLTTTGKKRSLHYKIPIEPPKKKSSGFLRRFKKGVALLLLFTIFDVNIVFSRIISHMNLAPHLSLSLQDPFHGEYITILAPIGTALRGEELDDLNDEEDVDNEEFKKKLYKLIKHAFDHKHPGISFLHTSFKDKIITA